MTEASLRRIGGTGTHHVNVCYAQFLSLIVHTQNIADDAPDSLWPMYDNYPIIDHHIPNNGIASKRDALVLPFVLHHIIARSPGPPLHLFRYRRRLYHLNVNRAVGALVHANISIGSKRSKYPVLTSMGSFFLYVLPCRALGGQFLLVVLVPFCFCIFDPLLMDLLEDVLPGLEVDADGFLHLG